MAGDTGRSRVVLLFRALRFHDFWVYYRNDGKLFIDRDAARPDAAGAGERSIDALQARLDTLQRILETRLPPKY